MYHIPYTIYSVSYTIYCIRAPDFGDSKVGGFRIDAVPFLLEDGCAGRPQRGAERARVKTPLKGGVLDTLSM